MTKITVRRSDGLVRVSVRGHSGYAESGNDIVCAAVTSALRMLECGLNDVLGLAAELRFGGAQPAIELSVPENSLGDAGIAMIKAFELHAGALAGEYPAYVSLTK